MPPSFRPVRHRDRKGDELAFEKDRLDDGDIGGMGVAFEWIIADEDVARPDRGAMLAPDGLDLRGERTGEDRDAVGL
jgi:hypothetical protein